MWKIVNPETHLAPAYQVSDCVPLGYSRKFYYGLTMKKIWSSHLYPQLTIPVPGSKFHAFVS